jgi:hypothetical protein
LNPKPRRSVRYSWTAARSVVIVHLLATATRAAVTP